MKTNKLVRTFVLYVALGLGFVATIGVHAGGFGDNPFEAGDAQKSKAIPTASAKSFLAPLAYNQTYDGVLTYLKKNNNGIDPQSSRDNGLVSTTPEIVKLKSLEVATTVTITLIKETATNTTVKVLVSKQERRIKMGIFGGQWPAKSPVVDLVKTDLVLNELKAALQPTLLADNKVAKN